MKSGVWIILGLVFASLLGYRVCRQVDVMHASADISPLMELARDIQIELQDSYKAGQLPPNELSEMSEKIRNNPWLKANSTRVIYFKCGENAGARLVTVDGHVAVVNRSEPIQLKP
jgi:hypothetical protein